MNILLTIHHELTPNGGAPGVTLRLGQEYSRLGHNVRYCSFNDLPAALPEIVKTLVFPEFVAAHIARLRQQWSIDVVDASTGDAWVWARLRQSSSRPLVVTRSHGLEHIMHLETLEEARQGNLHLSWKYPLYHGGFRLWEVAESLKTADLALLPNRADLNYAVDNLGVNPNLAQTFVNGVLAEFIGLSYEETPQAETALIRIAQVSTHIPRKGIHYSVPALNTILARYPYVQVTLLGTVDSEAQVKAAFDPAICDRVTVIPRFDHDTLPVLLQGHHIKLFPTLSEGFSVALVEAMACGLAPVTTSIPASLEIVQDGHNGILIPTRDSTAIEHALERLILDRPYLDRLRQNAYATAQRYSWETIAKKTLMLYEQSLSSITQ
jgi:glycosyltransferase involved in cell wall biosynthesis